MGVRLPPQRRRAGRRLAVLHRRAHRLVAVGRAHRRQRDRHRLRRRGQRRQPDVGRLLRHRPQREHPVVRPGDQPRDRPRDGPLRRGGGDDRRRLRRRLWRRGRIAGAEHLRAGGGERRHARRVPVVLGRFRLLDRRGGRPLRRRQQRDHQRRGLQPRRRLRADLRPRRPHPHPLQRRQRRDGQPGRRAVLPVRHQPEHRPLVAGRRAVPRRRRRRHRHRGRELLRGRLGLEQGLRHQHELRPGLEHDLERHHRRLARPRRRAGQRAARRDRGDADRGADGDDGNRLRAQRHQRRARVGGGHERGGHRVSRDRRPQRRRLPGRHRADDQRDRRLRRPLGRAGGDARRR